MDIREFACVRCGNVSCTCKLESYVFFEQKEECNTVTEHSISFPKYNDRSAVIFGVTGQDGSYLADILLEKGYIVIGVARRSSHHNTERIDHISNPKFILVEGDVTDFSSIYSIISTYHPKYVYNLAAQSHVKTSFDQPLLTFDITGKGVWNVLEVLRLLRTNEYEPRYYNAASSEMFGDQVEEDGFQYEYTKMNPQSPYSIAKLAGYHLTRLYRESYGMFACSGILFNHCGPRRGENFVTRKITKYVAKVYLEKKDIIPFEDIDYISVPVKRIDYAEYVLKKIPKLKLGNLSSKRDWGYAVDYCRGMVNILEYDSPDDYIIATGETYTVKDFLIEAFNYINVPDYEKYIEIDESLKRPAEVSFLRGKADKAKKELGWSPSVTFKELVQIMVNADIERIRSKV